MGRRAVIIGLVFLTACQASATQTDLTEPPPTTTAAQTTTSADPTTTSSALTPVDGPLAELRDLAFAYWEAFNAYDIAQVLSYLETDYVLEREETIRDDIDRLSTFGVKLGISELSPPVMLGSDRAEMYLEMSEPLGKRRIRMGFVLLEGDWIIDFAEEKE